MTTRYERGWIVLGGLTIGSMAAFLIYYFPWRWPVSALAVMLIGWVMFGMGQVAVTDLYRRHSRGMTEKWLAATADLSQARQWNRYLWAELTAIAGDSNGSLPDFTVGEAVPPEGSAGGS